MSSPQLSAACDVPLGPAMQGIDSHSACASCTTPTAQAQGADAFARVLEGGFRSLRFPAALETAYVEDKAAERLEHLRIGAMLMCVLAGSLLSTDWLMVPDQFTTALQLRLLAYAPLAAAWLFLLERLRPLQREWSAVAMSLLGTSVTIVLCLRSSSALGGPYLVGLALVLLFNGGVLRMPFRMAAFVDGMVLLMFAAAVWALRDPPMEVMIPMALVMASTAVFALFGGYWFEHEERTNWLLQRQEQGLLDELQQANARLAQLSRFDPLTGLPNRRSFDEFLQQSWSRARQDGAELALLMVDVDHFKLYNDRHGHPAGDACLKQVADALAAHLRAPEDLVARLGGEEFAVVMSGAGPQAALAAAERLRAGLAALALPHGASPVSPQLTVSVGAACLRANAWGASPQLLVDAADAALYRAKAAGRDRVAGLEDAAAADTPPESGR